MNIRHIRHPLTTQELRQSRDGVLVRAKRLRVLLSEANEWEDRPCARRGRPDRYKNHRR